MFQMFYGMPARILSKDGKPIHGTLGFVGALLKIIRMTAPTHAVVLFDGETHNPRADVDEEYKANRPDYSGLPEEETPFSQLPDIFRALHLLGLKFTETCVCETDDLVAGYVYRYREQAKIVVSSFDSDFFQLVSPAVSILRYRGDATTLCDEKFVEARFGVSPAKYADFKALVGDTADNIKGAAGIGPKTAASLLNEFGSLAELLTRAEEIKKPTTRATILNSQERLLKNERLIKLCPCDELLPFSLEELAFSYGGQTTGTVLKDLGLK